MFRIALHYICPYQVMEISIGDFGAFRDSLEAKKGWFSRKRRIGQVSQRHKEVPAAFLPLKKPLPALRNGDQVWERPYAAVYWSRCRRSRDEDSRNGTKCGSGFTQRCTEAAVDAREMKTQEVETKCKSGLTQRCDETAGKILRSLPRSYLSQRCDDEARKPLRVFQRLGRAVSRGRCESRKSTFSGFDQIITNLCFG